MVINFSIKDLKFILLVIRFWGNYSLLILQALYLKSRNNLWILRILKLLKILRIFNLPQRISRRWEINCCTRKILNCLSSFIYLQNIPQEIIYNYLFNYVVLKYQYIAHPYYVKLIWLRSNFLKYLKSHGRGKSHHSVMHWTFQ